MADSATESASSKRSDRYSKLLHAFVTGKRPVKTSRDGQLLIQAICSIEDHTSCVEKIGCSTSGLEVLRNSLRLDISVTFLNGPLTELLRYLATPEVKRLANGDFLQRILSEVVSPSTVWDALVQAQQKGQLLPTAMFSFAWLLLELLSWPEGFPADTEAIARNVTDEKIFIDADDRELRTIGYRVEHILQAKTIGGSTQVAGPGGRHDNDLSDFRQIAIYPTEDELTSKEIPFYSPAHALTQVPKAERVRYHLDNQFRLLREDFLAELREDISASSGKTKKGPHRRQRTRLRGLSVAGIYCGGDKSRTPFSLAISATDGLGQVTNASNRIAFLRDNPNVMRHHSFGYFVDDGKVIAFGTVLRVEDLLVRDPPVVAVRTSGSGTLDTVLLALKMSKNVEFVLIDTSVFAYEPILRCLQGKLELPLWEQILSPEASDVDGSSSLDNTTLSMLAEKIEKSPNEDFQSLLDLSKSVKLDESQTQSLVAGLRQKVSLIQGPPGTGKSFIGALLAKALHDNTEETILVLSFTNHALDQFAEDLLDIGIPSASMVRLGSKSSQRTKHLSLRDQAPSSRRTQDNWSAISRLGDEVSEHELSLRGMMAALYKSRSSEAEIMEHLEFSDSEDDYDYFEAFQVPQDEKGFEVVGQDGKAVDELYLLNRWIHYRDPGVFRDRTSPWHLEIWAMDQDARTAKFYEWQYAIVSETVNDIVLRAKNYDRSQHTLHEALEQKNTDIIQQKRIIACTTTAAAMYTQQLQSASPGIILVEEAGEILESHVLTALTPSTKQLILIGDHQQLRPKVNNFSLTVEKGDGYDLNRSLFERLVLAGYPHTTLRQQHRMCPDISALVKHLTYPELIDAPSTLNREALRGLQKRVVFVKHGKPEVSVSEIADRRDDGSKLSKQNVYEARMVKKVVKYMAQQGYGTSHQVVLTPYLGQLGLLRRELAKDNDPVLTDMDSYDLIKAGLISPSSASQTKRPLRLSTIDNYQGEESDIVIVSLTRSNENGDIGFMISPERLNVLLSRARKALILIGNPATFIASRRGGEMWTQFFDLLAKSNSILPGLPVRCEQHPIREMVLESPEDFDKYCPDGGCSEKCGVQLSCGLHECPQKCHRNPDHSKMKCQETVREVCPQDHVFTRKCSDGHPASCHVCDAEAAAKLAIQERNMRLEQQRQRRQREYASQLAAIQAELDDIRDTAKEKREQEDQQNALHQRQMDLETAKALAAQKEAAESTLALKAKGASISSDGGSGSSSASTPADVQVNDSSDKPDTTSEACLEWERQKQIEGAKNPALDDLMSMIGLEDVKEQFLEIKSKIDLLVRQGLSINKERFRAALLGNPGTGKTTVARLYAKFLSSVGALPSATFVESTGAKLASEGVQGCKKMLDDLLNRGGGAFFIDEAYQLASGSNMGGTAVLDFLLPEVENLTGKVVFILAGYNRQMEKFFAHNPGLPSRFPRRLQFADYEDEELLEIIKYNISQRYEGRMELEDGFDGLYARIVARRIGRGRGKEGFGNAREVENVVSSIASRQAKRLRRQRRAVKKGQNMPNDMLFTRQDLIGNEPANTLACNKAWADLQKMIGLQSVKDSVKALLDSIQYNFQRELAEEPLVEFSLNKVFLGNPGTGKTTVAKKYAQILADIGMLSSNEVVVKKPADFIGSVLGASEANTKAILDAAVGKVLVIDEAYGLYGGGGGSGNGYKDPFRVAVIDTIVAEVQSVPGDDRCVLLLGYKEQMEEMMQNVNPGLARRFPIDSGFTFEDFSDDEMASILDMKLKEQAFGVTVRGREVALEMLKKSRNRSHFGNAGEVDILLNDAKFRQQKRIAKDISAPKAIFEAQDFDPEHERGDRAVTNIAMLFKDTVGCDSIIKQLQDYQIIAANLKKMGEDPREQIPFSFLFRGPPGTGKTTTAQRMGKVFYDLGYLATAEVVSCSASDLIGEYIGQTGPKTRKLLESALGKVLFVDEAYRLAGGHFAQEAMDELVDCMTKDRYHQKLIIILAGYDVDMNRLMSMNPGLTSRFPETMVFEPLKPEDCLNLLSKALWKKKNLDVSVLTDVSTRLRSRILSRFERLASLANFANARDVLTLSKAIYGSIVKQPQAAGKGVMTVTESQILSAMDEMIAERARREADAASAGARDDSTANFLHQLQLSRDSISTAPNIRDAPASQPDLQPVDAVQDSSSIENADEDPADTLPHADLTQRDPDVSDAVWHQLQLDKAKAEEEQRELQRLQAAEAKLREWLKSCADAKRQRELEELERKRRAVEEKQRRETKAKAKLMQMGRCPVGYEWIRQRGGYRCAGGSHWVDDGQVEALMS